MERGGRGHRQQRGLLLDGGVLIGEIFLFGFPGDGILYQHAPITSQFEVIITGYVFESDPVDVFDLRGGFVEFEDGRAIIHIVKRSDVDHFTAGFLCVRELSPEQLSVMTGNEVFPGFIE